MHVWEIISGDGVDALHLGERERPIPGPGQVRVRMNANSINYRDLITIEGAGARKLPFSIEAFHLGSAPPSVSGLAQKMRLRLYGYSIFIKMRENLM